MIYGFCLCLSVLGTQRYIRYKMLMCWLWVVWFQTRHLVDLGVSVFLTGKTCWGWICMKMVTTTSNERVIECRRMLCKYGRWHVWDQVQPRYGMSFLMSFIGSLICIFHLQHLLTSLNLSNCGLCVQTHQFLCLRRFGMSWCWEQRLEKYGCI